MNLPVKLSRSERDIVFLKCIDQWGAASQFIIATEEYSELLIILCRLMRLDEKPGQAAITLAEMVSNIRNDLAGEIADAYIMTEQLGSLWACELKSASYRIQHFDLQVISQMRILRDREAMKRSKGDPLGNMIMKTIIVLSRSLGAIAATLNGTPATARKVDFIAGVEYCLNQLIHEIGVILKGSGAFSFQGDVISQINTKLDRLVERLKD